MEISDTLTQAYNKIVEIKNSKQPCRWSKYKIILSTCQEKTNIYNTNPYKNKQPLKTLYEKIKTQLKEDVSTFRKKNIFLSPIKQKTVKRSVKKFHEIHKHISFFGRNKIKLLQAVQRRLCTGFFGQLYSGFNKSWKMIHEFFKTKITQTIDYLNQLISKI